MILGSKEIFIPKYLDGTKLHSIREGERWRAGLTIHHYAKVRQPGMYKFMEDRKCISVQNIEIIRHDNINYTEIYVDKRRLFYKEMQTLAWNDGFSNLVEFGLFFSKDFKGQIVHWTDLKY